MTVLPLALTPTQQEFWHRLQPVNRVLATDTYKRTMTGSSALFSDNPACYTLSARIALSEEGANGRLIMAGLEKALYPFFGEPITNDEVETARCFVANHANVKAFPEKGWKAVLDNDGFLPVDIYALPGGQTFLQKDGKHVPILVVEGRGDLASHLEPHLCQLYSSIIQATKARLFREAVGDGTFAEFGLRSDRTINDHVTLMQAILVGGGFSLTSNDMAGFVFPEYFKDIGTMGHEYLMAFQKTGISLEQAQEEAFHAFVKANQRSALLPDMISTVESGLPAILRLIKKYQNSSKVIMPRFDSGDVPSQCIIWKQMTLAAGIARTSMVVEDGYTPAKARATKEAYAKAGFDPADIIVGAGGYFQEGVTRDAISIAYKRTATATKSATGNNQLVWQPSLKFSDSPGKICIPGRVRVYGRGSTLVIAQLDEAINGVPLMVKVVDNGRIVYRESLFVQRDRAAATWNQYDHIEYSPLTQQIIEARSAERTKRNEVKL